MNALKIIAGIALVCLTGAANAQGCAGHAQAKAGGTSMDMAAVTKELNLTAEQQAAFTKALGDCQKDCSAMASLDKTVSPEEMQEKKQARFAQAIASMKTELKPDQFTKLEQLNASGKLMALCSSEKGCCAGKSAKGACCAGKAGAKETPKETGATPTIQ